MVGRTEEIKTLDEVMSRKEGQLVAVYGRRRVGKTYLIRQYFKNRFTFYHTGESNVGFRDQLLGFRDSLRDYGHQCPLPRTWREAFRELRSLIEASADEKKVVFIDEMPWLDTPRSKFLPTLEHFWNSWGSSRNDLVMIVCGSASTWIIKNIFKNRGGLHNRITDQIHLMPFTLRECEELVHDSGLSLSRQEICSLYMIFGGVAYYWGFLRKEESVAQSVDRLLFSPNGKLRGEFDSMVSSLFKKDIGHRKVFTTLATKGIGMSREELLRKTGLPDGRVFCQILDSLEKCRCCIDRQIGDAVLGVSVVYVQNRWPVNVLTELASELVQRNLRIPLCRLHLKGHYVLAATGLRLGEKKIYLHPLFCLAGIDPRVEIRLSSTGHDHLAVKRLPELLRRTSYHFFELKCNGQNTHF